MTFAFTSLYTSANSPIGGAELGFVFNEFFNTKQLQTHTCIERTQKCARVSFSSSFHINVAANNYDLFHVNNMYIYA